MNDLVRRAQSDFINHPVTQTAIDVMTFVATGVVDGAVAIGSWVNKGFTAAKNASTLWPAAVNGSATVNGIKYTKHALLRMQPVGTVFEGGRFGSRGITPTVVEDVIKHGSVIPGNTAGTVVRIHGNVKVVTNTQGTRVITVIRKTH